MELVRDYSYDIRDMESKRKEFSELKDEVINPEEEMGVVDSTNSDNVVNEQKLRRVQSRTLAQTKNFLSKTFGPMGSNTKIVKGASQDQVSTSYSKDGLKVLRNVVNSAPIEASIVEELIEITRRVEKQVGDGTTSTVILSSLIFDNLIGIQKKYNVPPFKLLRMFESIVGEIKKKIKDAGWEATPDDMYDIALISTNGNEEVSTNIYNIYKEYGMNVDLSVGISNDINSYTKVYDGLTITEGMADPAYINNREDNTCVIPHAHVYYFSNPIDTPELIALFEGIVEHNIYEPLDSGETPIPTVVTCPKISVDMESTMKHITELMYRFDNANASNQKPPLLVITNVVASDELIMDDIANLCGCKAIRKYIDPKIHEKDIEKGDAPTIENVHEFYGECEQVISDTKKTKFINPIHMHKEDGEEDPVYKTMINFLETEIETHKGDNSVNDKGLLRKRLNALKSNAVDYLVGGVTIADRDSLKDLVEDAIKNCKSAAEEGVGYAANFMGLKYAIESKHIYFESYKDLFGDKKSVEFDINSDIFDVIIMAYYDAIKILYSTVEYDNAKVNEAIIDSLIENHPANLKDGKLDVKGVDAKKVKCSIMLDINILDTISRIIGIMVTSNQCLLQAPQLNRY